MHQGSIQQRAWESIVPISWWAIFFSGRALWVYYTLHTSLHTSCVKLHILCICPHDSPSREHSPESLEEHCTHFLERASSFLSSSKGVPSEYISWSLIKLQILGYFPHMNKRYNYCIIKYQLEDLIPWLMFTNVQ